VTRRGGIAGLLAAGALALAAGARAAADDMSLGAPTAPVTVIEYASLGCPHCGVWSREVFPQFKRRYIDTGKVRFVLRELLFGDQNVAAAGFLTARCAGRAKYFQVVEGLFEAQPRVEKDGNDLPSLLAVAGAAGLTQAQVSACLEDRAALSALEARAEGYVHDDHVNATPTFDVAGHRIEGEASLAALSAAVDAAQASARRRPR
jgi:protein-disulfide isomerase